ncbi:MAG: hypothetical protein ACRD5G_13620 [Candidatus Acidiferrales bacterium]
MISGFFLRAKHWQIFTLLIGLFVFGQIAGLSAMLGSTQAPQEPGNLGAAFVLVTALYIFSFLAWFWSLGTFLNSIVKPPLKLDLRMFRLAVIFPAVYIVPFVFFFLNLRPSLFALILPFHLFAMFCMFYNLYFVSKSLVQAETERHASFCDFAGPFFLLWFFPLGVWFIQPRVNRLYEARMATAHRSQ